MSTRQFIDGAAFEWEKRANCRDVDREKFYPPHGNDKAQPAKAFCRQCDVRAECLKTALENDDDYGIWGGTTPRERRKMRRKIA